MEKAEVRSLFKEKRAALSHEEVRKLSDLVCDEFFRSVDLSGISSVNCFLPAFSKNELDTWPIINGIRKQKPDITISVPLCDMEKGSMKACQLDSSAILKENKWGIPEPVDAIHLPNEDIDLVIMPLLAFDLKGNRVGYGKGFYDRFLAHCKPGVLKVGVSFFEPVQLITNAEPTDIPLTSAVTPEKVFYF